jgi:D-amino-acid dehydrogenase
MCLVVLNSVVFVIFSLHGLLIASTSGVESCVSQWVLFMTRVAPPVVVVGGGVIGVATAYVLAVRGYRTVLIEAREGVGLETSYANGAMLTPSLSEPWNAPGVWRLLLASLCNSRSALKLRFAAIPSLLGWGGRFLRNSSTARYIAATRASFMLAKYSIDRMCELRAKLTFDYDAARSGTLRVFRHAEAMQRACNLAEQLRPLGLCFDVLDVPGAIAVEPRLSEIAENLSGGVRFPDDETGDAFKFCKGLTEEFRRAGGTLRTDTPVTAVSVERGRVVGVESTVGRISAESVVVAAGNASPGFVRRFGVSLPIHPVKGYSVTFDASGLEAGPGIPVIDDAMHAALVPIGRRLRVVGAAEFAGSDLVIRRERIEYLIGLLRSVYPTIATRLCSTPRRAWAGLRPMSADGLPFVGATPVRGLYINAGHGHLGWTLAIGCAHIVSDLIAGTPTGIDCTPYHPVR